MNVQKEAARDAREYARAEMFFGEGAGTRRKLIKATVDAKAHRDPAYGRAFHAALEAQDMAEHAMKARRERKLKNTGKAVQKNVKGLLTGDKRGMQTGVLLIAAVAYVAHETGYDKKIYYAGKSRYDEWRLNRRVKKMTKRSDDILRDFTVVKDK